MKQDTTILAIGDLKDWESFKKFVKNGTKLSNFKYMSYAHVLKKQFPNIKTKKLIIHIFFPFEYWDKYIEPKHYHGVYASKKFYDRFVKVCARISRNIKQAYKDKDISYINSPDMMHLDRDKEITKDILRKHKVNIPKTIKSRSFKLITFLAKKKNLFIKVRYGAMGKGITFLSKDVWKTNFRFKNNKIKSKKSDYGWTFTDITNNDKFLKELLKQDITIEEEIPPYIINKRKFDLRMYISFGKVVYIYPRTNEDKSVTTNISQGGKGEIQSFLKNIPKIMLESAKKNAILATKAFNSNFAGIDIMFNGKTKKPVVIEVNIFPGYPASKRFNLSKRVLTDIKKWK